MSEEQNGAQDKRMLLLSQSHLSSSSLSARSMFMRWPTRVTPRSIRSCFCRLGRCVPSMSFSRKASLCSARLRLSSQSATSCLVHESTAFEANGLPEAACRKESGEGERLRPCTEDVVLTAGREEEDEEQLRIGGGDVMLGLEGCRWWCKLSACRHGDGAGTFGPGWLVKDTPEFGWVPEMRDTPSWFLKIK